MCGSMVLIARDVPATPVGERFRAVTRARHTFRGIITRTPVLPICDFPERARSDKTGDRPPFLLRQSGVDEVINPKKRGLSPVFPVFARPVFARVA